VTILLEDAAKGVLLFLGVADLRSTEVTLFSLILLCLLDAKYA
jgi:hypothetical protein